MLLQDLNRGLCPIIAELNEQTRNQKAVSYLNHTIKFTSKHDCTTPKNEQKE